MEKWIIKLNAKIETIQLLGDPHMVWGSAQEFAFQTSFPGDVHAAGPWTTFCHYFLTPWCKKRNTSAEIFFHSILPP